MTDHNIHYLVESNDIECIKTLMLVKFENLDITLPNENNETALDLAIKYDRKEIIELLNNFNNEFTEKRSKRNIKKIKKF